MIINFFKSIFLTNRVYMALGLLMLLFLMAFFFPALHSLPRVGVLVLLFFFLLDIVLLYSRRAPFTAFRDTPQRLSNGDENPVSLSVTNHYNFPVLLSLIDELPEQFQKRNFLVKYLLKPGQQRTTHYTLRPVERGVYNFGYFNVFAGTPVKLIQRRVRVEDHTDVPCYPSYIQMRRYQIMAISNRLPELGVKKVRKLGHSLEFEQIKDYVKGDDIRTINWKATARRHQLMVNTYTDERSQQIYCLINKGRVMKMPFNGLSLLDHAINAALVLTSVALNRQDKAGIITFSDKAGTFLPADRKPTQMNAVLETLYAQETTFLESDFEKLYSLVRTRISHRSLVIMFTNFESFAALERELPYLLKIARHHLLMVVFFENTEIKKLLDEDATNIEQVYAKTIAEKFAFEKRKIVRELNKHGILSVLTPPEELTVNAVNRYLELKTRQAI
jgi:uncharacterized protein (DUF58 family)